MLANSELLFRPNVLIYGPIDDKAVLDALDQINALLDGEQDLVVELNTRGGDADAARRIALEIKLFRERSGRNAYCLGKTVVYSAGVTILAAVSKRFRFLTRDAVLLIHERRLEDTISLNGPIKACIQIVREQLSMLETAEKLEMQGFADFAEGSKLSKEELYRRATENCYLFAEEAVELGLVAGILE
jgi:ATP-dependent protease ClpP protease subunit